MSTVRSEAMPLATDSAEFRRLLAEFFLQTHVRYVPEEIQWPPLQESDRLRLAGLPFWQEAVSTENTTASTVAAAAALEPDAAVREAIELQGFEEQRHARLLQGLTRRYRIPVAVPPRYVPRALEHDFLFAGFGECFDSFFAFGLFEIASRSGYFPAALVRIFEPVIQEEARHILFFVNWVRHRRAQLPWWRRLAFRARCAGIILEHVVSRVKTARALGRDDVSAGADNFTLSAHQSVAESVTLRGLLETCLSENERRLGAYDARLIRPRLVPAIARVVYRLLPARF